ncbi:MAG: hypothetical protein AAGU16_09470, partial [Desulfitobacterium hafniense]
KVRGREQSLKRLKQVLRDHLKESIASVAIVHGGSEKEARDLEKVAREHPNTKEVFFWPDQPRFRCSYRAGPRGTVGLSQTRRQYLKDKSYVSK